MSETIGQETTENLPVETGHGEGTVIVELATLPPGALLDETALARTLGVTTRTIRRMVGRYELPPAVSFAGRSTWQAGAVLDWFKARADRVAKEAERRALAFEKHSA